MFTTIVRLLRNEDGATAIEYGLIAALIAVAAVTVMGTVGTNLSSTFNTGRRAAQAGRCCAHPNMSPPLSAAADPARGYAFVNHC
jgi:pilus assembly protein Flp/PilA